MTLPIKKTLMDSGKDGLIITGGIILGSYILKLIKITPPIKFDGESMLKLRSRHSRWCIFKRYHGVATKVVDE